MKFTPEQLEAIKRQDRNRGDGNEDEGEKKPLKMGNKIIGVIFGLLFFLPGALIMGWGFWQMGEYAVVYNWAPAEASIISSNLKSNHDGDGSTTYRAEVRYQYTYKGQSYTGDRASLYADESDNIGGFQEELARKIKNDHKNNRPVTVYVDPDDPATSILSRDFRWGFFTFKFVFGLVFAGIGGAIVWAMFFHKNRERLYEKSDTPWLGNKKWQTPTIRSGAKTTVWFYVGFCAFWNAISWFTAYQVYEEVIVKNGDKEALFAMIFPVVGVFLIFMATKSFLEYRRFGATPVTLDPFPGSIGGHVGGTIDLNHPMKHGLVYKVTLTNIYSYMSGSGKNRSRHESVKWSRSQIAHADAYVSGTRLSFRFEVPDTEGLKPSNADPIGSSYTTWRLSLSCDMPGIDLSRDFEIPVYETGQMSRSLPDRVIEATQDQTTRYHTASLETYLPIRSTPMGQEIYYPYFRGVVMAIGGLVFGGVFAGAGYFMSIVDDPAPVWFAAIFSFIGCLIIACAIYSLLNSLKVTTDGINIISRRGIFFLFASRKTIEISKIKKLSFKRSSSQQQGGRHKVFYKIYAEGEKRNTRLVLAEGIAGQDAAECAVEKIKEIFNINHLKD